MIGVIRFIQKASLHLTFTIFGVFAFLLFSESPTALAWSGDLPACSLGSFNPDTAYQATHGGGTLYESGYSVVVYGDTSNWYILKANTQDEKIHFMTSSGSSKFYDTTTPVDFQTYVSSSGGNIGDESASDLTGGIDNATCLSVAYNVIYDSSGDTSYSGAHYPETYTPSTGSTPPTLDNPLTDDESKKFAEKVSILLSIAIVFIIVSQFRFKRHD